MHLQQFQERKFQKFTGVLPSDPLSFARQTWVPQNILPSYGNITSIPVSIGLFIIYGCRALHAGIGAEETLAWQQNFSQF